MASALTDTFIPLPVVNGLPISLYIKENLINEILFLIITYLYIITLNLMM